MFQLQPILRNHFNTSRWPPSAALLQQSQQVGDVAPARSQPHSCNHCSISNCHFRPAAFIAAKKGQLEILQWLHEWGCDLAGATSPACYDCCNNAAEGGHVEVLKWLRSIGCTWNKSTFFKAVQHDHVNVVKYMFENGFNEVEWVDGAAARWGSMATLRLLQSLNYKISEDALNYAAFCGNLNIVIWARNHGLRLSFITSYYAAAGGHLDTLKWLYANDSPWSYLCTTYA